MHTWFQLGGPAEYFAEPESRDELALYLKECRQAKIPFRILGSGSNILVPDEGVPGLVFRLNGPEFSKIEIRDDRCVVGCGAKLGRVVTQSVHAGLGGLESLIGIPGTIGGALHGNTGTQSGDVGQWVREVTVLYPDGQEAVLKNEEIVFSYRSSSLEDLIILEVSFALEKEDPYKLAKRLQKQWILRKSSQPMGHHCAGCIFKNPRGMATGELIESAGLKGTRIGGAVVSERHANFIVAEPECTSSDVMRLIDLIRTQVKERKDVELELELEIW
jgi:UDP-N-acetylmuramate dehydrogenase